MKKKNLSSVEVQGCFVVIAILVIASLYAFACSPISHSKQWKSTTADSALSAAIKAQLSGNDLRTLYFPKTVKRFYIANGYQRVWLKSQTGTGPTWQAMLMLDCVLQFGLSHADYHPHELMYNKLHEILEKPGFISIQQQARFEIMLTDAMINFMNNLHFGKLNPYITSDQIDNGNVNGFNAEGLLAIAVKQTDLMAAIGNVQPRVQAYTELQRYMQLRVGQESGDCYDVPDSEIRKMAINLDRLRWADMDQPVYIQINIPTYTLTLHEPDSVYHFKVIVGKPQNPSPQLNSDILNFTTSPEWKIPNHIFQKEILPRLVARVDYENLEYAIYDNNGTYIPNDFMDLKKVMDAPQNYHATQSAGCDNALGVIVFRFPNLYDTYLHDTPEKQLFDRKERAFSHGCIRVENAEQLADLLLKYDGQTKESNAVHRDIVNHRTVNFKLKKALPIRLTYITCTVGEYGLVTYNDIYDLDNRLEMTLNNDATLLAKK